MDDFGLMFYNARSPSLLTGTPTNSRFSPIDSRMTMLASLTIHLHLPTCASLKEKRGRLKPLISRLRREFNLSVAEIDLQDRWQEAVIACAMIGSGRGNLEASMQSVAKWVEANWPDGMVVDQKIEIIP